jgi:demethylmenaquinone methyltransferase/2-methoxy-6-polyprenyl-1,4-benzoquinol methylase
MSEILPYPHEEGEKKEQVAEMFDNISANYDLLNRLLSFGVDKSWRKKAITELSEVAPSRVLDVATGTADIALEVAKRMKVEKIIGIDISVGMLGVGKKKVAAKGLEDTIELQVADSENIPFGDGGFDGAIVAFGVRNFANLSKGLSEMSRVLKENGKVVILEFSQPKSFPVKQFYNFYSIKLLPLIGKLISKDDRAYRYLPESVKAFPEGEDFLKILKNSGFKKVWQRRLTFGICSIYCGLK